jgi:flagellar basal-body rod modification protein FlgD
MTDFHIDPTGPLGYLTEKPPVKVPDNNLGKDAFLKLLVAQMKYQNPMEPADATDFIAQTAQFTLVEQMENMASANEDMLVGQRNATAASMVGQKVQWTVDGSDEEGSPGEGTVQGVRITAEGPILIVDGWDVPLSRVTAFGETAEPPTSTVTPPVDGTEPAATDEPAPVEETEPAPVEETEPPATDETTTVEPTEPTDETPMTDDTTPIDDATPTEPIEPTTTTETSAASAA